MTLLPGRVYAYFVEAPMDTPSKLALDVSAFATTVGAIAGYMPAIAALFSVIWLGLQIYGWFEQRRERRRIQRALEKTRVDNSR